jgi:site-specific DNA-methyltransferase (adenine-specific)/site-specific DNA-methyltransferase (cytosine-N4-specific)
LGSLSIGEGLKQFGVREIVKNQLPLEYDGQVSSHIIHGDCLDVLKSLPDNSVDLIVTSPPYADQRAKTYGGVKPEDYVDWFRPIGAELFRVLKEDGTFILNIKEKVVNGERHTYVLELIIALREMGWKWTEEFIWSKKNSFPGKWSNRFRDGWERLLQFNKAKQFNMYQDEVRVPVGSWAETRLKNLSETDKIRDNSKVGSGFGKNVSSWVGRDTVYPNNVLVLATESGNKSHSAVFPISLPSWFIKLFTVPGDVVLDPFFGSGTTGVAAMRLDRNSIGIEILDEYLDLAEDRISSEAG